MSVILRIKDKATGVWKEVAALIGPKGDKGDPGEGVPSGGTLGQFLRKRSATDFDTGWASIAVPAPAISAPSDLGSVALVGSSDNYAKEDHVHKMPTASEIGAISPSTLGTYLVVEAKTGSATVAANASHGGLIYATKSGYTPIGIVGFACGNSYLMFYGCYLDGTSIRFYLRNVSSIEQTTNTISISVLYRKNS